MELWVAAERNKREREKERKNKRRKGRKTKARSAKTKAEVRERKQKKEEGGEPSRSKLRPTTTESIVSITGPQSLSVEVPGEGNKTYTQQSREEQYQ